LFASKGIVSGRGSDCLNSRFERFDGPAFIPARHVNSDFKILSFNKADLSPAFVK
jgi:hypothetical protein